MSLESTPAFLAASLNSIHLLSCLFADLTDVLPELTPLMSDLGTSLPSLLALLTASLNFTIPLRELTAFLVETLPFII